MASAPNDRSKSHTLTRNPSLPPCLHSGIPGKIMLSSISPRPLLRAITFQTADFVKDFYLSMMLEISWFSLQAVLLHSMSLQTTITSPSYPLRNLLPSSTFMSRISNAFLPFSSKNCTFPSNTNTCVNLSTFAPPYSHGYLDDICSHQENLPPAPIFARHLEQHSISGLGFLFLYALKNLTSPWLEPVNATVLVNKSINNTSLMVMVCVPTEFVFVCDGYNSS